MIGGAGPPGRQSDHTPCSHRSLWHFSAHFPSIGTRNLRRCRRFGGGNRQRFSWGTPTGIRARPRSCEQLRPGALTLAACPRARSFRVSSTRCWRARRRRPWATGGQSRSSSTGCDFNCAATGTPCVCARGPDATAARRSQNSPPSRSHSGATGSSSMASWSVWGRTAVPTSPVSAGACAPRPTRRGVMPNARRPPFSRSTCSTSTAARPGSFPTNEGASCCLIWRSRGLAGGRRATSWTRPSGCWLPPGSTASRASSPSGSAAPTCRVHETGPGSSTSSAAPRRSWSAAGHRRSGAGRRACARTRRIGWNPRARRQRPLRTRKRPDR